LISAATETHRERERERERERKPYMKVRKHKRENGYLRAFGFVVRVSAA
jgi:hypothetical protein